LVSIDHAHQLATIPTGLRNCSAQLRSVLRSTRLSNKDNSGNKNNDTRSFAIANIGFINNNELVGLE
jgi:hypothetical protein